MADFRVYVTSRMTLRVVQRVVIEADDARDAVKKIKETYHESRREDYIFSVDTIRKDLEG